MQHLQSLKSLKEEETVAKLRESGRDEGKEDIKDQWFHFKGTQTSSLHTRRHEPADWLVTSLEAESDRMLNHNSVYLEPQKMAGRRRKWRRRGVTKEARKSMRHLERRSVAPPLPSFHVFRSILWNFRQILLVYSSSVLRGWSCQWINPHVADKGR